MKKVLILLLAVIVIGGLFYILRPQPQTSGNDQKESGVVGQEPDVRAFALDIRDGEVVSGDKVLRVTEGDDLRITVTSDTHDELHLHGYDKSAELTENQPVEMRFTADMSGRFEAELHHAHQEIFVLEVLPK